MIIKSHALQQNVSDMEKINTTSKIEKVPSGVSCIDDLMDGGLEPGVITEIYGEGGAGKTNLSLQFAISVLSSGFKVIFLDTEGLSVDRLLQTCSGNREMLKNLLLYRITSLDDQELSVIKADKMIERDRKIKLLIIDSFTEFFRLEKSRDFQSRVGGMQKNISLLSGIAVRYSIPVLITNQIYMDVDTGKLSPFGGYVIDHSMKAIYNITKKEEGERVLAVSKHRSIEEGRSIPFWIVSYGLSCSSPKSIK